MLHTANSRSAQDMIRALLQSFSVEITPTDEKSVTAATDLPSGTEVFIASLPTVKPDQVIGAAVRLRRAGLIPVPHLAARNIASEVALDDLLKRLTQEAGVDRALVIGGDRDEPAGAFREGLQLLQTGLLGKHGLTSVYLPSYPEGHPRISDASLAAARRDKLDLALSAGFRVGFISQFCFAAEPIVDLASSIHRLAPHVSFRAGVAGPTSRAALLKYALICGVGPSLRAFKERPAIASSLVSGETPEALLGEIADRALRQHTRVNGVHFFTFGSLARTVAFIRQMDPDAAAA